MLSPRSPSPPHCYCTTNTPLGELVALADRDGRLTGLRFGDQAAWPPHGIGRDAGPFAALFDQISAYFAGQLRRFDAIGMAPVGTPFQLHAWRALRDIPFGATVSYGQLAAAIGRPGAARPAGAACRSNPIAIVVPCHRVIGAGGQLTGYAGGLQRKRALLAHERSLPAASGDQRRGAKGTGASFCFTLPLARQ